MNEARANYVTKTKQKLAELPRHSKQWWRINRELMHKKGNMTSIPTLRNGSEWLTDPTEKANAFANTFAAKSELPPEAVDTPFFGRPEVERGGFVVFRARATKRFFAKLDVNKATGNDQISAAILKELSDCISVPFTKVCRRLFQEACWPSVWKYHLVIPIYKKGAAFQPGNYRGIHLTTILSKVAEKVIGAHLFPYLQDRCFGEDQWAFSKGLSSRDLVTMLVMSCILVICSGKKNGCVLKRHI